MNMLRERLMPNWFRCNYCDYTWKSDEGIYYKCVMCGSKNLKKGETKLDGTDK